MHTRKRLGLRALIDAKPYEKRQVRRQAAVAGQEEASTLNPHP